MNATPPTSQPASAADQRGSVPGAAATVRTLAGITLVRLGRGKALWISLGFAALPIVTAAILHAYRVSTSHDDAMFGVLQLVQALLAAMLVASSIGEDIEDRTATYLWSRPIARWAVPVGKLCALAPIVIALTVAGWFAAIRVWTGAAPPAISGLALAVGGAAASMVAAGIAIIVPRHAMAVTIGYLLLDSFLSVLPFSVREITIGHQVSALAGTADDAGIAVPLIALIAISAVWAAIGGSRIRRLEV